MPSQLQQKKDVDFSVIEDHAWQVITPNGNLTQAAVDDLRALLLDLTGKGITKYRFDLSQVLDLDAQAVTLFFALAQMLGSEQNTEAELEVVNANEDIRRCFNVMRLNRDYRIIRESHDSPEKSAGKAKNPSEES